MSQDIMSSQTTQDSPLSITASVAGILTFVIAAAAAAYVRITYLRNASDEFYRVKQSLNWYKTESLEMSALVNAADMRKRRTGNERGYRVYCDVMDNLIRLEERLLELLALVETRAIRGPRDGEKSTWTLIPRMNPIGTTTAVAWLSVRTKALELVRQRDALGSRVLFAQLSMVSSQIHDQESRAIKQEENFKDRVDQLERTVHVQNAKLDQLEALLDRFAGLDPNPMFQNMSRQSTLGELSIRGRSPGRVVNLVTPAGR